MSPPPPMIPLLLANLDYLTNSPSEVRTITISILEAEIEA